jgi:phage portal protein BeeE
MGTPIADGIDPEALDRVVADLAQRGPQRANPQADNWFGWQLADGPNENESWQDFLETLVSTTLLRGNGTARLDTDARGRLVGLTTLPWDSMAVRVRADGRLLFDYTSSTPPQAGQRRTYAREDLLWLKDRSDTGLLGAPRLQRAAGAMSYAVQIQKTAQTFSANAARPGGVLQSPTPSVTRDSFQA